MKKTQRYFVFDARSETQNFIRILLNSTENFAKSTISNSKLCKIL